MKMTLRLDNHDPEIQALKTAMKETKDKRYQTILLHLQGATYDQISAIVGRSTVTIVSM